MWLNGKNIEASILLLCDKDQCEGGRETMDGYRRCFKEESVGLVGWLYKEEKKSKITNVSCLEEWRKVQPHD